DRIAHGPCRRSRIAAKASPRRAAAPRPAWLSPVPLASYLARLRSAHAARRHCDMRAATRTAASCRSGALHLGPTVAQADRAVEDRASRLGIRIEAEIALPLELHRLG